MQSYRWAPFLPVGLDSSMLTVLLLLSKYRLRNVPVIETGKPCIKNFITQTAVVQGLRQCKGRDWFDCISARTLPDLGLPFMLHNEVTLFFWANIFSSINHFTYTDQHCYLQVLI